MSTAAAIIPVSVSGSASATLGEDSRAAQVSQKPTVKSGETAEVKAPQQTQKTEEQAAAPLPSTSHLQESITKFLKSQQSILSFEVDQGTKQVVVRVLDPETREVLKQYPPEEILKMAQALDRITGNLIDERI